MKSLSSFLCIDIDAAVDPDLPAIPFGAGGTGVRFLGSWAVVRLRSMLRAAGLIAVVSRLRGTYHWIRMRRAAAHYRRNLPDAACLWLDGLEIRLKATSEAEYIGAMAFRRDRHLIEKILASVDRDGCFWDVGANVGAYSCFVGKRLLAGSGSIVAFEPDPRNCQRLIENLALNGLANATTHRLALAEHEAEMSFAVEQGGTTGHLLTSGAEAGSSQVIQVRALSGDLAIERLGIRPPSVLKIDTEGYEPEILRGLQGALGRPDCRFVLVEVHFSVLERRGLREAPLQIEGILRAAGFHRLEWLDFSHLAASKP